MGATGLVRTFAGHNAYGHVDGDAMTATLGNPDGLDFDSDGSFFVADKGSLLLLLLLYFCVLSLCNHLVCRLSSVFSGVLHSSCHS